MAPVTSASAVLPAAATTSATAKLRRRRLSSLSSPANNCSFNASTSRLTAAPFPRLSTSPPPAAAVASDDTSPFDFDLSPPPIEHELDPHSGFMLTTGSEALDRFSVETSTNDANAISAALNEVAIADLSHFGRIRVSGDDRIQFLHNQTTAKFDSLKEGEGCDTVFVTPTARTIDVAHALIMKNSVILLVSPHTRTSICEMLQKYIFPADKVEVCDITKETCFFVLVGPKSSQVMKVLQLSDLIGQSYGTHRHYNVNGTPVTVGVGSILFEDGLSFLLPTSSSRAVWKVLLSFGAVPLDADTWERLRVLQGRPAPGKELTRDFNVLEAGLWKAVSVDKGCYKGQETIARLITYDGIKQKLWGVQLSGPAEPGSAITTIEDGRKVGVLTSYSVGREDGEHFGLGYVRRQVGLGEEVRIGDVVGTLVHVPFLRYPFSNPA